jgi:sugar phosphate isomerase/epimerase
MNENILTGITDEAGADLEVQLRVARELGWNCIEARSIKVGSEPAANLHDISESAFDEVERRLGETNLGVHAFGSTIANWGKKIDQPFEIVDVERCVARMKRLKTKYVRIMSYAVRDAEDQMAPERFRRLNEICRRFLGEGLRPLHENCMNYGGMGWPFTLELLENVPGLKLVFDTANPVFNEDRSKPAPRPKQDPWEFWTHVRDHVEHIHVKDARWNPAKKDAEYTFPGEGDGAVARILGDALSRGYSGAISIEPHMAVVFHDATVSAPAEQQYANFVEYARRLRRLVEVLKKRT